MGPWILAAWAAVTLVVLAVYPHHTLMDLVQPGWALAVGQILSYLSGIPVLLVTIWGALANLHRSGVFYTVQIQSIRTRLGRLGKLKYFL